MLPSKNRVKRGEIEKSASNRRLFRGVMVSISMVPGAENSNNSPKITVIVSKKIIKTAVSRNRLKRRIYSIMQEHLSHMQSGIYMIYIKKESKNASYRELKDDINNVLKKI